MLHILQLKVFSSFLFFFSNSAFKLLHRPWALCPQCLMHETAPHIKPSVKTNESEQRCPCVRLPDSFDSLPLFPEFLKSQGGSKGSARLLRMRYVRIQLILRNMQGPWIPRAWAEMPVIPAWGRIKVIISYLGSSGSLGSQTNPKPKQNSEKGERQAREERGPPHNGRHDAGAFCLGLHLIFPTALLVNRLSPTSQAKGQGLRGHLYFAEHTKAQSCGWSQVN